MQNHFFRLRLEAGKGCYRLLNFGSIVNGLDLYFKVKRNLFDFSRIQKPDGPRTIHLGKFTKNGFAIKFRRDHLCFRPSFSNFLNLAFRYVSLYNSTVGNLFYQNILACFLAFIDEESNSDLKSVKDYPSALISMHLNS